MSHRGCAIQAYSGMPFSPLELRVHVFVLVLYPAVSSSLLRSDCWDLGDLLGHSYVIEEDNYEIFYQPPL